MRFKRSLILSFSVLFVVVFVLGLLPSPVGAVSYYNWVLGSDMETATNYVEDGGFESGAFNSGVLYGNWSSATWSFSGADPNSGVYDGAYMTSGANILWYNFTDVVLGADIDAFTLMNKQSAGATMSMTIYYSDETTDVDAVTVGTGWAQRDVVDNVNDAKYVVAFSISKSTDTTSLHIDDVFLGIEDDYSQEQYDFDTYPWRTTGLAGYYQSVGYWDTGVFGFLPFIPERLYPSAALVDVDYIGHNLVWGRNSNGSGYIGYDESTAQFVQDVNYLDSDSVHYVDLWAYSASEDGVAVKFNVIYSDRTWDSKSVNITVGAEIWEHLNFGGNWIDDNKYIVQIQISLANYYGAYVNIDDVGVWSSLPANSYRFTFTLSPSVISQSAIGFDAYQGSAYVFTGYLWDSDGELTENGTVSVSHGKGSTSATLSMGVFSFTIAARSEDSDFTEQFGISVNTGAVVEYYELTVNWVYVDGGGSDDTDDLYGGTGFWSYAVFFMIVFAPPCIVAGAGSKDGWGAQGFIVTLGLTTVAGVLYLGLPFYVVFLIGMGMAIMLFAMLKRG